MVHPLRHYINIAEAFHDAFYNNENSAMVEIYVNPSARELQKLVREWQKEFEIMWKGYVSDVRIILTKKNFYCWGAAGSIHPNVQTFLNLTDRNCLRIEWTPNTNTVAISSIEDMFDDEDSAESFVLNHPMFKIALPQVTNVEVRDW